MAKPRNPNCTLCGNPKGPGQGRRVCDSCRPLAKAATSERAAVRKGEQMKKRRRQKRIAEGRPPYRRASDAPDGKKWCSKCERYRDWFDFGKNKSRADGLATYCVDCYSVMLHERNLRTVYGISRVDYDALLISQGGRCAICENKPRTQRLAVDHNHQTGQLRGLLCKRCNQSLLGAAHDDLAILRRAVAYLEHYAALADGDT